MQQINVVYHGASLIEWIKQSYCEGNKDIVHKMDLEGTCCITDFDNANIDVLINVVLFGLIYFGPKFELFQKILKAVSFSS